ncbi:MAG: S8 family serine peptidase [Planctomycetota bacterium]
MAKRNSTELGASRFKVQPKLRMIANGDTDVNLMRADHCASVCAASAKIAEGVALTRAEAAEEHVAPPKFKKLRRFSSNVTTSVLVTLRSEAAKKKIKGETLREGSQVTATVKLSDLADVAGREDVVSIELGTPLTLPHPQLGAAGGAPSQNGRRVSKLANHHRDGKGVVIGIIDVNGFDFAHEDFREAGGTRFLRIWDQGGRARKSPRSFGYGAEFEKKHLDAAIKSEASLHIAAHEIERQSQIARSSHGTHVASIAAGNRGVCRKAKIVGVLIDLPDSETDRRRSFYDSTRVIHAVEYILRVAAKEGLPASINISLGTNGHAHDGSSAASRWMDGLLSVPGRAITVAAGNAGQEAPERPGDWGYVLGRIHSSGRIPLAGSSSDLEWQVVGNGISDLSENELEIWYSPRDSFEVQIKPPGAPWTKWVQPGQFLENSPLPDGSRISIYNERYHPSNGDNHIAIYLSPLFSSTRVKGVRPGMWVVRIRGIEVKNGVFHAWIERDDPRRLGPIGGRMGWLFPSFFSKWSNVDSHSISSMGCGERILSVANLTDSGARVNVTSSQGPTRDGRTKPEVAANGTDVVAANGFDPDAKWIPMTGTSMASPYVAGVVGLMLTLNPTLTAAQIRGILRRTATPLPGSTGSWDNAAGFGAIDPGRCVEEAHHAISLKEVKS